MEKRNAIALTYLRPQIPSYRLMELYSEYGSATSVVEEVKFEGINDALRYADQELEFCEKHSIRVLLPDDKDYPQRLLNCDDAPLTLFYRGNADLNARHIVSIIGTRKCTTYGQDLIRHFVEELKTICPDTLIVSGLAYGVDIHAHRNALQQGMETVGVLAHGLDTIYPTHHRETAKQMLEQGGLLTEYHSKSFIDKRNFLQRNRIVAGMCDAVVLPESASHGGGLVTCRLANEYGRAVFAYPGAVNAEFSAGCNTLIRSGGATMITCATEFVEDMRWNDEAMLAKAREKGIERSLFPEISAEEKLICDILKEHGDVHPEQIVALSQMSFSTVKSLLFTLEMAGMVKQVNGGVYHLL